MSVVHLLHARACLHHTVRSTSLTAEELQRGLIDRVTSGGDLNKGYGSPHLLRPVFALFGRMELNWDPGEELGACCVLCPPHLHSL